MSQTYIKIRDMEVIWRCDVCSGTMNGTRPTGRLAGRPLPAERDSDYPTVERLADSRQTALEKLERERYSC